MIVQPDLLVIDALKATLAAVADDPSIIEDILDRPADEVAQAREYFATHKVPVKQGWPRDVAELPGLYVLLAPQSEDKQVVGSSLDIDRAAPGDLIADDRGTWFAGNVRTMAWATNADLAIWLSTVALAGLLVHRDPLQEKGLLEQRLSVGDFMPLPQWLPDFAFGREVTLSSTSIASQTKLWQKLRLITVAGSTPELAPEVFVARSGR